MDMRRDMNMRLPKFRCKNKAGNWCYFTVLHNGNMSDENFYLETLSESTGLFDKQGVEIYDGDIVKCSLGVGQINYIESYFRIFKPYVFSTNLCNETNTGMLEQENAVEIIGNIYENPELLKSMP